MVFRRFITAYGTVYIRVVVSSLVLMIVGVTLLQVGVLYLGVNLVIPPTRILEPLPPPHSVYVPVGYKPHIINLTLQSSTPYNSSTLRVIDLYNHAFAMPGYMVLSVKMLRGSPVIIVNVYETKSIESQLVYRNVIQGSETIVIPIPRKGSYKLELLIRAVESSLVDVEVGVYEMREKPDALIAKWLQGTGLVIFLVGALVLILSPIIARKYAEASYMIVPEKVAEKLAGYGITRIYHGSREEETSEQ